MIPTLQAITSLQNLANDYDVLIYIYQDPAHLVNLPGKSAIARQASVDPSLYSGVHLVVAEDAPAHRLILALVGPLDRDYDDVRRFADTARLAVQKAASMGAVRIAIVLVEPPTETSSSSSSSSSSAYQRPMEVALLGALQEIYVPLEAREWKTYKAGAKGTHLGIGTVLQGTTQVQTLSESTLKAIHAMEQGRLVARDITGSDPERMASLRAAEYLEKSFAGAPNIKLTVLRDPEVMKKSYPLLHAVARASLNGMVMPPNNRSHSIVERHMPAVVKIEYRSPKQAAVKDNLFFIGKGITYDTGGADVKTGGHMRGMSRDKGGAAGVSGFMKTVSLLQPEHLNITAYLGFVRNSIGSNAYVSDEIIVSRAGVRVLVGNTDAEGRMVMADLLAEGAEDALKVQQASAKANTHLFTVATLTGHVIRAYGPYPACLDNGPARKKGTSVSVAATGSLWGEPWEVSTLRREDYAMVVAKSAREDVVQCNTAPSTMTSRGHQFPAAFMMVAAGVDKCCNQEKDTLKQLAYTHMDIAGAAEEDGPSSGSLSTCTGAPVTTLTARFLLQQ